MLFSPFHPVSSDVPDRKLTSDEEEARRIAEMGKPVLGEHSKLEVIIEESYEFKVGNSSKRQEAGCCFFLRLEQLRCCYTDAAQIPQLPPCQKEQLRTSNFSFSGGDMTHMQPLNQNYSPRICLWSTSSRASGWNSMPLPSCGGAREVLLLWMQTSLDVNDGMVLGAFFLLLIMTSLRRVTQSTVDKLIKKTNLALVVGTNSWRDQFMEAITVSAGRVGAALPSGNGDWVGAG